MNETRTYRGGSLEELLPRILEELGPEAVVTKQREGVLGGIGGFFGKRCVEVEVEAPAAPAATAAAAADAATRARAAGAASLPRRSVIDAYDMGDTLVGVESLRPAAGFPPAPPAPVAAPAPQVAPAAPAPAAHDLSGGPIIDAVFAQALPFADHLTSAAVAAARGAGTTTLEAPGSWADDLDLSQLDDEEFQPLPGAGLFAPAAAAAAPAVAAAAAADDNGEAHVAEDARAWALQEIRTMKRGIAERQQVTPSRPAARATAPVAAPAPARAEAAPAATVAAGPASQLPVRRSSTELVAMAATLSEAGLPEQLVLAIHKDVARDVRPFANDLPVRVQARAALAKRIKTKSGWRGRRRTIALVGAAGSGKTLTAAKLCHAFAVGGGLSVGALSLESPRQALQLGWLTEGIGVDFQIADFPAQVPLAAGRLDARDLIVVDTPDVDASDPESVDRLESLLNALRPDETHFLVPASADIEPSQALLDALAARLGVDRILITRLDEAPALGAQVALSISTRLPISYLASGATPDFGLAPADPVALASMVLP